MSEQLSESEQELKKIIKEAVQEEMMKFRSEFIPFVSDEEQNEINELYGSPTNEQTSKNFQLNL